MLKQPLVIYADFESLTEKVQRCVPDDKESYTESYQKQTCCSYGYKVGCCFDNKYSKPVKMYRGENAAYKFLEDMLAEAKYCKNIIRTKFHKPLRISKKDEKKTSNKQQNAILVTKNTINMTLLSVTIVI